MVAAVSPTDPMNERGSHVLIAHLGFKEGAKLDVELLFKNPEEGAVLTASPWRSGPQGRCTQSRRAAMRESLALLIPEKPTPLQLDSKVIV